MSLASSPEELRESYSRNRICMPNDHPEPSLAPEHCTVVISSAGTATLDGALLRPDPPDDLTDTILNTLQQRAQSAGQTVVAAVFDTVTRENFRILVSPDGSSQVMHPDNGEDPAVGVDPPPDVDTVHLRAPGHLQGPAPTATEAAAADDLTEAMLEIERTLRSGDLTRATGLASRLREIIDARTNITEPSPREVMEMQAYIARLRGDHLLSATVLADVAELGVATAEPGAPQPAVRAGTAWRMLTASDAAVSLGHRLIPMLESLMASGSAPAEAPALLKEIRRKLDQWR
jgi:hypothetical protein